MGFSPACQEPALRAIQLRLRLTGPIRFIAAHVTGTSARMCKDPFGDTHRAYLSGPG